MTFIASVVAKNGVAVIADSLVTTSRSVLEADSFFGLLERKMKAAPPGGSPHLDPNEIIPLFSSKPSHTKDFEDKLWQFDRYTAITTTGNALVNGRRIGDLLKFLLPKIKGLHGKKVTARSKLRPLEDLIEQFRILLDGQVREYLLNNDNIGSTTFIISHYVPKEARTRIFNVTIPRGTKADAADTSKPYTTVIENPALLKVVCDGQNRLSEKLLFGVYPTLHSSAGKIIDKVITDFQVPPERIPADYRKDLLADGSIVPDSVFEDLKILKLADLSLQQAVDLARLLMRIEIDFQKYTENIPTVGGVVKIAIIDEEGFKFIAGHEVGVSHPF